MKFFEWLQELKSESPDPDDEHPISPALQARLAELEKMSVREVMIPRSLIMALDVDVQLRRVRRLKSSKTVYFPVYKGDLDHVLGWIPKQKVIELMNEPSDEVQLSQHLRPLGVVKEDASAADLADAFLKSASPFLIVKSFQGSTVGIVPLAEFIELVFGFTIESPIQSAPSEFSAPQMRSYEL